MMRLWLLRPIPVFGYKSHEPAPAWHPWYDKAFGHVVRADSESDARRFASEAKGDEGAEAWLDPSQSSCVELTADGEPGVVLTDYHAA